MMRAAVQANRHSSVALLTHSEQRRIVRRRLQAASSRLCRRHDKRNRRWPLAQSHKGTTPAVSSSPKRSPRQAREQNADGALEMEGRLVVERRLVILNRLGRCCWLAPHRLPYAHQTVDPKRGEQGSSIASLARRLGQRQACKRPRELSWLPCTAAGRSTPPRETHCATELSMLALME